MDELKSSHSQADSYEAIGEFWDANDLGEHWEATREAQFSVATPTETTYFPVERGLSEKLRQAAKRHGVSPETLLNLWLHESVARESTP